MKKPYIKQLIGALLVPVLALAPTTAAFAAGESDTYTTPHAVVALEGTSWTLEPEPAGEPTDELGGAVADASDEAVDYLASQQNEEGNIEGYGTETEWTVIAVVANGEDPNDVRVGEEGKSLVDFLKDDIPDDTTATTDIERKILAISAAGEDTTDFGGIDYNTLLKDSQVDGQLGPKLDNGTPEDDSDDYYYLNDDWFGIMAIEVTEDEELVPVAQNSLDFIIENQKESGGFSYTTQECGEWCAENSNDTAAAIVSFASAERLGLENADFEDSKNMAVVYLLKTRNDDGGFGYMVGSPSDTSSTSWGLIALNTLGEAYEEYITAAQQWLLGWQNDDGGFGYAVAEVEEEPEEEPIVATPIETPVIAKVASAVSNVVSTYRAAATTTATPVAEEPTDSQTSSTVSPEVKSDVTPETEETEESSAGRIVGYILIALALAGFLGYIFRLRSAKTTV